MKNSSANISSSHIQEQEKPVNTKKFIDNRDIRRFIDEEWHKAIYPIVFEISNALEENLFSVYKIAEKFSEGKIVFHKWLLLALQKWPARKLVKVPGLKIINKKISYKKGA